MGFKVAVLGSPNRSGFIIPDFVMQDLLTACKRGIRNVYLKEKELPNGKTSQSREDIIGQITKWEIQEGLLIATVELWMEFPGMVPALSYWGTIEEGIVVSAVPVALVLQPRKNTYAHKVEEKTQTPASEQKA